MKLSLRTVLMHTAATTLGFCCATNAWAGTISPPTVTVTYQNGGSGTDGDGYYVTYPVTVSGGTNTALNGNQNLMCLNFGQDITVGGSAPNGSTAGDLGTWSAVIYQLSDFSGTVPGTMTKTEFEEAAYIFSLSEAPGASAATIALSQWAEWQLFDANGGETSGDPGTISYLASYTCPRRTTCVTESQITTLLSQASTYVAANPNAPMYAYYEIYCPIVTNSKGVSAPDCEATGTETVTTTINGSKVTGTFDDPQTMMGNYTETPEPGSFLLLGSGLLGLAGIVYTKRRKDAPTAPDKVI